MRGSATMNRSEREEIHETSDHVERRLPRWLLRGAEQVGPRANPRRLERGPGAVLTGPARLGGHAAVRARDVRGHGIALAVGGRPGRGLHEQRAEGGLLEDAGKSGLEQHAAGAGSRRGGGCAAEGAAREEHPDLRQRRPVFDPDAPRPDRRVPRRREPDRARAGHAAVQAGRGEQGAAARGCEDSRQGPGDPELPAGGRGLSAAAGGPANFTAPWFDTMDGCSSASRNSPTRQRRRHDHAVPCGIQGGGDQRAPDAGAHGCDGGAHTRDDGGRRAARHGGVPAERLRRAAPPGGRQGDRDGRPVHRVEGGDRRFRAPPVRIDGGGGRVGQALPGRGRRRRDGDPAAARGAGDAVRVKFPGARSASMRCTDRVPAHRHPGVWRHPARAGSGGGGAAARNGSPMSIDPQP